MTITPDLTLGELVAANPGRSRVLETLGLNYCCGGHHTLREACAAAGLDEDRVVTALARAPQDRTVDWDGLSLEQLGDVIVTTHQEYLWRELPRLAALIEKVTRAHAGTHPELLALREVFDDLLDTLEPHLREEAGALYPAMVALEAGMQPEVQPPHPIRKLRDDHEQVGELLARLREISGGFTPPPEGCTSYRAMEAGLADLAHHLQIHVHLENTELFPRAQALGIP